MKVRNNSSSNTVSIAQDNKLCVEADLNEREMVYFHLASAIHSRSEAFVLDHSSMQSQKGSSFYYVHKPFQKSLLDLVRAYREDVEAFVTRDGLTVVSGRGKGLLSEIQSDPDAHATLKHLMGAAEQTGGVIRTSAEVSPAQWMRFHGLNVPTDLEQADKMCAFLKWKWPKSDQLVDYWEQINGHDNDSGALTAPQCAEIRRLTSKLISGGQSLLDLLYENVSPELSDRVAWENANEVIFKLVHHSYSYELAQRYIDALGWWGARDDQVLEQSDLAQVLYTAIILQLDPFIGVKHQRNQIGSYDIYEPRDAADRPLHIIRQGIEQFLISNERVSPALVPLASHLMLSSIAPGFLVKNVPSSLTAGSIGWVTFSQAVSVVELNVKGASRLMTYEEVMQFADLDSISQSMGQLQGLTAIDAIIDWALINEVISHSDITVSASDAAQRALTAYQTHVENMVNGVAAFSTPVPNRKKLALAALEKAIPGCDFFESPLLRPEPFSSMRVSMLDLHIEGELTSGGWDWNQSPHILTQYPQLLRMARNQDVFKAEIGKYHYNIHKAVACNIKLAMAGMPSADRDVFERSKVTFFTVRPPVVETIYPKDSNYNLVGVGNKGPKNVEVQANIDQARGRFGVIMIASYGNDKILCYEVFSLLGECRRNDALGNLVKKTQKFNMPSRLEFKGGLNDAHHPLPETHNVPTDFNSYIKGERPRPNASGKMVIEKLGELLAPTSEPEHKRSLYQYFVSPHVDDIAQFIVTHRPVGSVEEFIEAFGELTEKERKEKTYDEVVTYIVDLVVPFKKCTEDLASGDRNKVVDGVYACTMDAIGILFTVLGAPASILSIAAKTVSSTAKLGSFVRYGLQLTVSTFNPIDGLPTAGYRASKALFKSGMHLQRQGAKLLDKATSQLNRLTGKARSVDLLHITSLPHLGQGKWRPRGSATEALNVCAFRGNNDWYSVTSRGKPWGKALPDFEYKRAFTPPSIRPESYTAQIIQQSLPIARQKLDNAISVLNNRDLRRKTDLTIGLFLGSKTKGRDDFLNLLNAIRLDFDGTSASNFFLDSAKVDDQMVQVEQSQYNEWKKAGVHDRDNVQFMTVNTKNLNDRFDSAGFNYGEVANDLIHEMFRAGPGKTDLVSAKVALKEGDQSLNVAGLLNLAAGRLPSGGYHGNAQPQVNADTYALLTALLSQLASDANLFSINFGIMNRAVRVSEGRDITDEVLVNLDKA